MFVRTSTMVLGNLGVALREASTKISTAVRELKRHEDEASSWVQRWIQREVEQRIRTRDAAYWDRVFPGLSREERANRRIRRMLTRCTVAGVAAATGASTAEVLPIVTEGMGSLLAAPIGIVSVGAEALYTTALQIDLAFDLASIYEVPFAPDDVGEISTLLALALGVELVNEPSRHDKPEATDGGTKPWRVVRQMQRTDFAKRVSKAVIQQSVLRNVVPVVGVLVSAVWNQLYLRRFAEQAHNSVRQRLAIMRACRGVQLGDPATARIILDGAWLMATADSALGHYEALALSKLIDSLTLPERIGVHDASFTDDEEGWFERVAALDPRAHEVLVDVLALVASADGELNTPERRFLLRLAHTLGMKIDLTAIQHMVTRLREGEAPGPLSGVPAPALMPA